MEDWRKCSIIQHHKPNTHTHTHRHSDHNRGDLVLLNFRVATAESWKYLRRTLSRTCKHVRYTCLHASAENPNMHLKLDCSCIYLWQQMTKTGLLLSGYPCLKCGDWCSEDLNMFIFNKIQSRDNKEADASVMTRRSCCIRLRVTRTLPHPLI